MKTTKKAVPIFTLCMPMYEGSEPEPRFAFHATDEAEALSKAQGWMRYHSFPQRDASVRLATENEVANWLHDEHVS